jgi:hypothetical protein
MDFITFGILLKTCYMKLRLSLLMFCLLGIGVFSHAQDIKKTPPPPPAKPAKPTVLMGDDAIPVTVKSSKKLHANLPPPPPPPKIIRDGQKVPPPPPPKVEAAKFTPPKIVKDVEKAPPPPPAKPKAPIKTDAPPKDPRA